MLDPAPESAATPKDVVVVDDVLAVDVAPFQVLHPYQKEDPRRHQGTRRLPAFAACVVAGTSYSPNQMQRACRPSFAEVGRRIVDLHIPVLEEGGVPFGFLVHHHPSNKIALPKEEALLLLLPLVDPPFPFPYPYPYPHHHLPFEKKEAVLGLVDPWTWQKARSAAACLLPRKKIARSLGHSAFLPQLLHLQVVVVVVACSLLHQLLTHREEESDRARAEEDSSEGLLLLLAVHHMTTVARHTAGEGAAGHHSSSSPT